jgi:ABC-type transport system substrate-binding protein
LLTTSRDSSPRPESPTSPASGRGDSSTNRLEQLALVCITALILLRGPEAISSPADHSVVFGQSTAIVDLGPAYAAFQGYPGGYEASFAVYDRLVTFDADLNIRPQLAERWERSTDNRSMTFFLRRGARFHDGTPVNADAVKFNINRMMNGKINTTNRPLWDPIAAAEVLDDYTIVIRSHRPFALMLNTLAHGSGALVSPSAIRRNGQRSMTLRPVGAGPFMVEKFTPGQILVLKAFDDYWGGKPKTRKLVFRHIPDASTRIAAMRSGAVDIIDSVPVHMVASLTRDPRLKVLTTSGLRPMGLAILSTREPLSDLRVRHALNHAVPVKIIAAKVFMGHAQVSDAPLAFNTVGHHHSGSYEYSPARAKTLLAEAGFEDRDGDGILERNGKPFDLTVLTSDGAFPKDVLVAQVAAHSLKVVGIKVTIAKVEQGSYWDALRLKSSDLEWDLALFGFNPSNASGLYHLSSMYQSNPDDAERPAVWNIARFRNTEVDELLEEASVTVDLARRKELLGSAQSLIWNEAPYVWLYVDDVVSAARRDLVGAEVWPISFTITRNAHY